MPKSQSNQDYYVYVYIDPRNLDEFYYGKGRGKRKESHLKVNSNDEKSIRIAAIRNDGLEPLIRVIARGLSEAEAFLIEKTLLWKLGKNTTNKSTGHFGKKFRPQNTLHKEIHGFDFGNSLYYYNVGENEARNWDDYRKYGYISAGWGTRFRDAMLGFKEGDIVVAHLKKYGYVGVGKIRARAQMIRDVRIDGVRLIDLELKSTNANHDIHDKEESEYACLIKWIKSVPRENAKWKRKSGLYTTPMVRASLESQPSTIKFIEHEFGVDMQKLLK
jgi:uncharacterized protein